VWESVETLKAYVYRTAHAELLRDRRKWFGTMTEMHLAMWWVPAGRIPSVDEARERLEHIRRHGPSPHAFTFREMFAADGAPQARPARTAPPAPPQ
jgi:hypothetical protein